MILLDKIIVKREWLRDLFRDVREQFKQIYRCLKKIIFFII